MTNVNGRVFSPEAIHGKSAYEIALLNGFVGTEKEWLASISGSEYVGSVTVTPNEGEEDGLYLWHLGDVSAQNPTGEYGWGNDDIAKLIDESNMLMIEIPIGDGETTLRFIGSVGYGYVSPTIPEIACKNIYSGFYLAQVVANYIFNVDNINQNPALSVTFTGYKLPKS